MLAKTQLFFTPKYVREISPPNGILGLVCVCVFVGGGWVWEEGEAYFYNDFYETLSICILTGNEKEN